MISLPYNHRDELARQRPLPLAIGDESFPNITRCDFIRTVFTTLLTATGTPIHIRLDTDSQHLADFFSLNWPPGDPAASAGHARIVALRKPAATYGLPSDLECSRWHLPARRQIVMVGSEYYGNLKITVRGLCSELAPSNEMFLHGCALAIAGDGIVLSGASGSGKTTLTAAIRNAAPGHVSVVNDDWGPFSLSSLESVFTAEPMLHMKYPSVRTLAPDIAPSPESHPSENFNGDLADPHARLLITRSEVFGSTDISERARIRLFALVIRSPDQPPSVRALATSDLGLLSEGKHASYYDRVEHFMNGSLFLTSPAQMETQLSLHRKLLGSVPCIVVNNSGPPPEVAALVLEALRASPCVR